MKIIKNKKGDKIISVYWFAILFIVAAAVAYMVILFYGAPKDIRQIEARVLTNQIADCFSEGGYLKEGVLSENFKTDFLKECHLNFNVEDIYDWKEQEQYYVEVNVYNFEQALPNGLGDKVFDIVEGNVNLKTTFLLEESKKRKKERDVDFVVIHYTAGPSLESARNEFEGNPRKSIHYLIDRDGTMEKGEVEESEKAKHAGCEIGRKSCHSNDERPNPEEYEGEGCCRRGINERSIGIEIVNFGDLCGVSEIEDNYCNLGQGKTCKSLCEEQGNGVNVEGVIWEKYTEEQMNSLVSLVSGIVSRHDIPIDRKHIIGHSEVDSVRKKDPGPLFPWEEFIERLKSQEILSPAIGRDFYVVDKEGNQYVIKILSIIGKGEKGESSFRGFGGGEFGGGGTSR